MTVTADIARLNYVGNGVLVTYPFTWEIYAASDLKVYVSDVLQAVDVDYTIAADSIEVADGGNVVFDVGSIPALDAPISIVLDLPLTQLVDYIEGDKFPAETHERALDRLIKIAQEFTETLKHVPKLPTSSLLDLDMPAPSPDDYIGWNAAADNLENKALPVATTATQYEVDALISYGSGTSYTDDTILAACVAIGTTDLTTLLMRPGAWVIDADLDLSSYTNIFFEIAPGVDLQVSVGKTLTFYSPENIIASPRQQIISGAGALAFTTPGVVYPNWWGAVPDGDTDAYTAFDAAITACEGSNSKLSIFGVYEIGTALTTSTSESESFTIEGSGPSASVLLFNGVSGLTLASTGMILKNVSIFDKASFTVPPTAFPTANAVKGNITGSTIGLHVTRNNIQVENVLVEGFDNGVKTSNSKYYTTFIQARSQFNLTGYYGDTNFIRFYGSYITNNFDKNINLNSGSHSFVDTSIEGCDDYTISNTNYPDGGIYIAPGASGTFERSWIEDCNVFNRGRLRILDPFNLRSIQTDSPTINVTDTQYGSRSKNLVKSPFSSLWTRNSYMTKANTQLDSGKRYVIITANGAGGVAKDVASAYNYDIRGLLAEDVSQVEFNIYFGAWVQLKTANFDADTYPYFQVQIEEEDGDIVNPETVSRTHIFHADFFDNTDVDTWQFIGCLIPFRYTLASGDNLAAIRLRLVLGDNAADYSGGGNARTLWLADPEVRFYMTSNSGFGNAVMTGDELRLTAPQALTISAGGVIVLENTNAPVIVVTVETNAGGATDNLDTITATNISPGTLVIVRAVDATHTVVVRDGAGNIQLAAQFDLDHTEDTLTLQWDGSNFVELSNSNNG